MRDGWKGRARGFKARHEIRRVASSATGSLDFARDDWLSHAQRFLYGRDQKHIGTWLIQLKAIADTLAEDRRSERAKAFPELYFQVQRFLHFGRPGVSEDRAISQAPADQIPSALGTSR